MNLKGIAIFKQSSKLLINNGWKKWIDKGNL